VSGEAAFRDFYAGRSIDVYEPSAGRFDQAFDQGFDRCTVRAHSVFNGPILAFI